jgi:hypothetical protein
MTVSGVVIDPTSQVPVVVLRGVEEPRLYLPIFVGAPEATAIATVLAEVSMPRPLTHDLLMTVLDAVSCRVTQAHVTHLEEGTFFATLQLCDDKGGTLVLDARPSDALALALRAKAPVFVAEAVLVEAGGLSPEESVAAAKLTAHPENDDDLANLSQEPDESTRADASQNAESPEDAKDKGPRSFFRDIDLEKLNPEDFGKYKM